MIDVVKSHILIFLSGFLKLGNSRNNSLRCDRVVCMGHNVRFRKEISEYAGVERE